MKNTETQEVLDFCKKHNLTIDQFYGREEVKGDLYLNNLTFIPEGFNPIVGGDLYLNNLTSIPEGFNPIISGDLYLNNLTSIPEGFNLIVGGYLDLRSLTSIPEGFNPIVGGSLDLSNLTSIPEGFNPIVGGDLYLNNLTSIPEGFNPKVGGYLYLNNKLAYNYTRLPDNYLFSWENGKYIKADGIFTEVISKKGSIYKVKDINKEEPYYLVSNGEFYSHGKTIKEAKESLVYKIKDRDTSKYDNLTLDTVLNKEEAIKMYRTVTGACEYGTKQFVEGLEEVKEEYKVYEIIYLTKDQYGNKELRQFLGV